MTCAMSPLLIESLAPGFIFSTFQKVPSLPFSFSCHYIYLLYLDATVLGLDVSHLTTKSLKLLLPGLCGLSLDWIADTCKWNYHQNLWNPMKGCNFLNKDVSFSYCRKCICGELSVEIEWEENCIKFEVVVLVYSEYQIWVSSQ